MNIIDRMDQVYCVAELLIAAASSREKGIVASTKWKNEAVMMATNYMELVDTLTWLHSRGRLKFVFGPMRKAKAKCKESQRRKGKNR